jgi:hypothetical protein
VFGTAADANLAIGDPDPAARVRSVADNMVDAAERNRRALLEGNTVRKPIQVAFDPALLGAGPGKGFRLGHALG